MVQSAAAVVGLDVFDVGSIGEDDEDCNPPDDPSRLHDWLTVVPVGAIQTMDGRPVAFVRTAVNAKLAGPIRASRSTHSAMNRAKYRHTTGFI